MDNVNKYIKLKKEFDEETDIAITDKIQNQLEELYFELNEEEIAKLELNHII